MLRLTGATMSLVADVLERKGVLDTDAPGPGDSFEALVLWENQDRQRSRLAEGSVTISAVKFESNDPWFLSPRECEAMADALRDLDPELAKSVIEADYENDPAIALPLLADGSVDFAAAAKELVATCEEVSRFTYAAAEHGGFRVG